MSTDLAWIFVEHREGTPAAIAAELAAAARSLGARVEAVAHSAGVAGLAGPLGAHGVERVLDCGDLGDALVAPRVTAAIAGAVERREGPDLLLIPATYDGRDLAARLSARLDRPVLTNVVGIRSADGGFVTEHALFGGTEIASARFTGDGPAICVVRPKSFPPEETGGGPASVVGLDAPSPGTSDAARVVERHVEEQAGPSLDGASVVVSGGRGLGSKENYGLIERLAELLGGAAGASRAIVDAGWVPYSHQVGQTGKIVKPEVYLAFGISGATQHLVGMKSANHIVAVNRDETAPIFQVADLGVVGDLQEILPKLLAALEARS